MFESSSVRCGSFSVRVNFRPIISGVSSGRISVRSIWVIWIGLLLRGLVSAYTFIYLNICGHDSACITIAASKAKFLVKSMLFYFLFKVCPLLFILCDLIK